MLKTSSVLLVTLVSFLSSPLWLLLPIVMCSLACWKCFQQQQQQDVPLEEMETSKNKAIKAIVMESRENDQAIKRLQQEHERVLLEKEQRIRALEELLENNKHHQQHEEPEVTVQHAKKKNTNSDVQFLQARIVELETKAKQDCMDYQGQLKSMREEHVAEIDQVLLQLDNVEQEEQTKTLQQTKALAQKETIIHALSTKLEEFNRKEAKLQDEYNTVTRELQTTQEQVTSLRESMLTLELNLSSQHELSMTTAKVKHKQEMEQLQQDILKSAQEQFDKANETYILLKTEYEKTRTKLKATTTELKAWKQQAEQLKQKYKDREVKSATELAQLASDLACAKADASNQVKQHNAEIQSLQTSEQALKEELARLKTNYSTTQATLASTIAEKKVLLKEFTETKSVCEELMTIMEQDQKENTTSKDENATRSKSELTLVMTRAVTNDKDDTTRTEEHKTAGD